MGFWDAMKGFAGSWGLPAVVSGGLSALGGLVGGGESEQSYQMSPEMRQLYGLLMGQMQGGAPSYVTSPITSRYAGLRRDIKETTSPGLEGLLGAKLTRATAGESRALTQAREMHQMQIYQMLSNLLRGTGTQTTKQGTDWGSVLGGIGGDVGYLWGLEEILKQGG